ncbi:AMP-binding protein [Flavobacterium cheonanense]|uniref:AMP-binding protein n=1 Tax=Flavobacterium cheonanense TaxID=706183 RepID=UPI0031E11759
MKYFYNFQQHNQEQIALLDEQNLSLTYGELSSFINSVKDLIPTRSLVFHFSENSVPSVALYLACLSNRAVPVLLNPLTNRDLIDNLLNNYQPQYLIIPQKIWSWFNTAVVYEYKNYRIIEYSQTKITLFEDLALLLPTSGSTGSPKMVRHSYQNISTSASNVASFFQLNQNDRPVVLLPMYYTMGLSVINSHLEAGATLLLFNGSLTDISFWNMLKSESPTSITGVPYTFEILKKLRFFKMNFPTLKLITQGGGKMSEDLLQDCIQYAKDNNLKFIPTYGQTEGTARMAFLNSGEVERKKGSIGKAIPNGKLTVIDDQGIITNDGEATGEMVFQGPNVTLGYAENILDLNKGDERKGYLQTGDIVRRDNEGFYFIIGRKSRFLKLFGLRVSLDELELLIKDNFHIECVCKGNDSIMNVYLTNDSLLSEVKEFIIQKTGLYHKCITVKYIVEFPRNETGKILLNAIED